MINKLLFIGVALSMSACATGPTITTVQELSDSADVPYGNVLVVSLFSSFDMRRYFEKELVREMSDLGIKAVASTSLMDSRTPVVRQTFVDMVKALGSDAVLVTQMVSFESAGKMKDMNPESTHNIRETQYYNVWSVELAEYTEPQGLELKHSIVLATQMFSARTQEPVWAIESTSRIIQDFDKWGDFSAIEHETKAIGKRLLRDGLISK